MRGKKKNPFYYKQCIYYFDKRGVYNKKTRRFKWHPYCHYFRTVLGSCHLFCIKMRTDAQEGD